MLNVKCILMKLNYFDIEMFNIPFVKVLLRVSKLILVYAAMSDSHFTTFSFIQCIHFD